MDNKLEMWMNEIKRYNKHMHLVGPQVLKKLGNEVDNCVELLKFIKAPLLADLGSGSGLPGIPYAVMNPASKVILIERSEKKCLFLKHVVSMTGLLNVEIINLDPIINDAGKYPAVISRAFSPKEELWKALCSIMDDGGVFYYMGSVGIEFESRLTQEFILDMPQRKSINIFSYRFNL